MHIIVIFNGIPQELPWKPPRDATAVDVGAHGRPWQLPWAPAQKPNNIDHSPLAPVAAIVIVIAIDGTIPIFIVSDIIIDIIIDINIDIIIEVIIDIIIDVAIDTKILQIGQMDQIVYHLALTLPLWDGVQDLRIAQIQPNPGNLS